MPLLRNRTPTVVAQALINNAGIVGAALAASEAQTPAEAAESRPSPPRP